MKLQKFTAITAAFSLILTACASSSGGEAPVSESNSETVSETVSETAPAETAETTAETTTEAASTESMEYTIASLKGPTTMGMVKLMEQSEKGETANKYNVTIHGTADEIVAGAVSGNTNIANVPANLAAVLYNKTEGKLKTAAVNTLGVLYIVTSGEEISGISDLAGKTILSTGKGTTPEYVLNHILRQNGLEPQKDVMIEYKTEASECAAVMAESENAIAVLPQPYVTAAQLQNENIKIALSLTDEWDKISETPLITGVTIAQSDIIEKNPAAFDTFLSEYEDSVKFVNENTDEAAELIGGYDIVKTPVAKKALPYCNITLLRDDAMKNAVSGYWIVLFEADKTAVGGSLPDDSAFYIR